MTELEKLKAGLEYDFQDKEVDALKRKAIKLAEEYNKIPQDDYPALEKKLKEIFGSAGNDIWAARTFSFDNGKNIHVGNDLTINYNVTILDIREVYIGNHVMIGPNTLITTVNHPLSPKKRREHKGIAKPVYIGNDVWIGGNVTILPGVHIGNNVVIGAGAVVTKDIEDNSVVVGVPAKVIKKIENDVEE